ncbi:MAG: hypothetical protein ACFFD6_00795 [Candidatus Thorarchaeota archaeon]
MSGKARRVPSLKTIKSQYEELAFKRSRHIVIATSSFPESTISAAILCRTILRLGGLFHITFVEPVMEADEINNLRNAIPDSSLVLVGVDVTGKKRIKKGKSYPIFIGGTHDSEQVQSLSVGNELTVSTAAYVMADSLDSAGAEELQLAAAATLLGTSSDTKLKGAVKEIVASAQKDGLMEERKGFKLFGVNFLPLNEVLAYSIRPYLPNLSGKPDICDKIYEEADIPFSKFRTPLSSLTADEAQRMNAQLLPKLDPSVIPQVLGQDFILTREATESPVRLLSGMRSMAENSWTLNEPGACTAIWLGDRARVLRGLLDSYMVHSKEVIAGVGGIVASLQKPDSEVDQSPMIIPYAEARDEILCDLGRIVLEAGYVETDRIMMVSNDRSISIMWKQDALVIQDLFRSLKSLGLSPKATSSTSLRVPDVSEQAQASILNVLNSN